MKHITSVLTMILMSAVASPPPVQFMDDTVYTTNNTCYTAKHDIVDIHAAYFSDKFQVFLVQADVINNQNKGITLINFDKNLTSPTTQTLLENGKCITADEDAVYFGTTTGIYIYNFTTNSIEKYGSVSVDIKDIEKSKSMDLIYVVSEDNKLYKITEKGNSIALYKNMTNVLEIVMDNENNLYYVEKHEDTERYLMFYERYKKPKVIRDDSVIDIDGLPEKYDYIKLINAPLHQAALVMINNKFYNIHSNGSSTDLPYMFLDRPTAYALELGLIQFYGSNRKLYCFSIPLDQIGKALGKAVAALVQAVGLVFKKMLGAD